MKKMRLKLQNPSLYSTQQRHGEVHILHRPFRPVRCICLAKHLQGSRLISRALQIQLMQERTGLGQKVTYRSERRPDLTRAAKDLELRSRQLQSNNFELVGFRSHMSSLSLIFGTHNAPNQLNYCDNFENSNKYHAKQPNFFDEARSMCII